MVKQNIRTRKNNQRKRRTKIQKGGRQGETMCRARSILASNEAISYLTEKGTKHIPRISPEPDVCSKVDISNVKITEKIVKESIKDLKSLLINNNLFEKDRIQFTFNCFKNFRAYGCPYESIIMEKDTTFENFLNFSSFANSFEDVEFLDLRNVKDMAYIPINLSKMISLKYLLLPNEFAPPPEEDFKDAAEAGENYGKKIENEVHIFDIIRMMPSLRYVEAPKPPEPYKQEVEAAKAKKAAAAAKAKEEAEQAGRDAEAAAADPASQADRAVEKAITEWEEKYPQITSNQQIKPGEQKTKLNKLKEGSIFKIPTDILEMYGTTPKNGEDLKIRKILEKFKGNNNVLLFPNLNYGNGDTYQPNLIVNFSGESFY